MSILTDLFDAQLAVLQSDFKEDLLPIIQQANNLIASNPTELNIVAQAAKILQDVIAEGPKLGQDEIKSLTAWVNSQLQRLASPPVPAVAAKTLPPSPLVVPPAPPR